jgi:DNA-binding transcriptional LysR family regulator
MERTFDSLALSVQSNERIHNICMADIRSLDIALLRGFDALMRERSVSRAAKQLFLSQPATSALLARLREVFGDPLFVRTAAGVAPTARAEALAEPVRRVLADLQALLEPPGGFDAARSKRVFHIASTDYMAATLLGPLAARLGERASGVQLAQVTPDVTTLVARMTAGDVDAALMVRGLTPRGLRVAPLFDEDFVFAFAHGHPLAARRRLSAADMAAAPQLFIAPREVGSAASREAAFSGRADQALQALGLRRFVQLSVPNFSAAVDVIERSQLAAVLPRRVAAAAAARIASRELPFEMSGFTMDWVLHPRAEHDPGLAWLREEVLTAWHGLTAPARKIPASPKHSRGAFHGHGRPRRQDLDGR